MGYRRALSFGWEKRDTLAVLVIALTVSFLVGAALLGVALGNQTTTISDEFGTGYGIEHTSAAPGATQSDSVATLALVHATVDGEPVTIVGVPDDAPTLTVRDQSVSLPAPAEGTLAVVGGPNSPTNAEVAVNGETTTVSVTGRSPNPVIEDTWYVGRLETVSELGPTERVALTTSDGDAATPLLSALRFFVLGTEELVRILQLATLASGILVGVTIYSVVRITIKERRPDIAVLRSTGATPLQVVALYTFRAVVLSGLGLALGYSFGVIIVRAVLNAAIYLGLPTSLSLAISPPVVGLLGIATVVLLGAGIVAGILASYPEATAAPEVLTSTPKTERTDPATALGRLVSTQIVGWEAAVPVAATLSVFMGVILLLSAIVGAVGPLSGVGQQTITEPDAPHPIASNVPESYATTLRGQGIDVSPEILLFEVYDDTPFVARGVNYSAYSSLARTTITDGRPPQSRHEALVGADLTRATGIDVGETIVVGGSTTPGLTRVEVVGKFEGSGIQDDQLLVSLDTARHLTTTGTQSVQFIRTRGLADTAENTSTIVVTSASVTRKNGTTGVEVSATNLGLADATRPLTISLGESQAQTTVSLESRRSTTVFVPVESVREGTQTLAVGEVSKSVTLDERGRVVEPLTVTAPAEAPVDAAPQLFVSRGTTPVSNATISVAGQTVTTNDKGRVRVSFNSTGSYTVTASDADQTATTEVSVSEDAQRRPLQTLSVSPDAPSLFTKPTATVIVSNPWEDTLTTTVSLRGPNTARDQRVSLPPGATKRLSAKFPQRPAGEYTVTSQVGDAEPMTRTYAVQGDQRLGVALAESGRYSSGGGLTQAIQLVFGNIEVLLAAVITLMGVMTVGSTTAAFTRSIYSARHMIGVYRATGARRQDILALVFIDTLKIGLVSAVGALVVAVVAVVGLLSLGELRVFGIALTPTLSLPVVAGMVAAGVLLAVTSASLATVSLLLRDPAALLVDRHIPVPAGNTSNTHE
ncbi:FtsX-like permease family protein [Haloferax sp. S1W]|uniref:ABC transporter permease n=1 Tax=Haloferax sp. S1W TaxID=3377110 RepID=UPI0037C4F78E